MNATSLRRIRWFWPWQDDKEEAWLESMSQEGWHLKSLQLPCCYFFEKRDPCRYVYRLDYMPLQKDRFQDYLRIFQDAGWEYIGEMSNWRYWRKLFLTGEVPEIFTDTESKIRKYQGLLGYMVFFLFILIFLGTRLFLSGADYSHSPLISAIYMIGRLLYVVLIPIYVVVVIQLLRRINQLKKKPL